MVGLCLLYQWRLKEVTKKHNFRIKQMIDLMLIYELWQISFTSERSQWASYESEINVLKHIF